MLKRNEEMMLPRQAVSGGWRPITLFALVFSVCAVGLSLGLRAISPMPYIEVLADKLDYYEANAADYDTVFIGTSRTYYHIVPEAVADGMSEAGCPRPRVFNYGLHGLKGAEMDWLLDQVMTDGAGHLKRIIIEDPLPEAADFEAATDSRGRYFHGPEHYRAGLASTDTYTEGAHKRLARTGIFGLGVLYDLSGVGRASELFFPPQIPDYDEPAYLSAEGGFEALDEINFQAGRARHEAFVADLTPYRQALAAYDPAYHAPNIPARVAYLKERLSMIEAAGIRAALYVSPQVEELDHAAVGVAMAEEPDGATVLHFNQPDRYPDLFDETLWYDIAHMGREGAEMLSRKLGAELCAAEAGEG